MYYLLHGVESRWSLSDVTWGALSYRYRCLELKTSGELSSFLLSQAHCTMDSDEIMPEPAPNLDEDLDEK